MVKINRTNRILLFMCGDESKVAYIEELARIRGFYNGKKEIKLKSRKRKKQRATSNESLELLRSLEYPYPIRAKYISKYLKMHQTTVGKLLRDLRKGGYLSQRKKFWIIGEWKKIIERFYSKSMLVHFFKTKFFYDFLLERIIETSRVQFSYIKPLKKLEFESSLLIHSPLFIYQLTSGLSREDIETIFEYMFEFVFNESNYKKYFYQEIAFFTLMYYYQLRFNEPDNIKDSAYLESMKVTREQLQSLFNIVNKKIKAS